jgi:hypothetical protein
VRDRRPVRGDDAELTRLAAVVAGEDGGDRLGRREPLLEPGERLRPVDGDAGGLRGDRSDPRLCPRHDRADREVLRLDRATNLLRDRVDGANGEGSPRSRTHGRTLAASRYARGMDAIVVQGLEKRYESV